jgi:hypothetical protein
MDTKLLLGVIVFIIVIIYSIIQDVRFRRLRKRFDDSMGRNQELLKRLMIDEDKVKDMAFDDAINELKHHDNIYGKVLIGESLEKYKELLDMFKVHLRELSGLDDIRK